jgi:thiol:disulfide interchange protein DsbD
LAGARDFLPPDEAFAMREVTAADGALVIEWDIAPGYYLYRDKTRITALTPGASLAAPELPTGEMKDDPEFGKVAIWREHARVRSAVVERPTGGGLFEAEVRYQGCAEDGICYPPIRKPVAFGVVAAASGFAAATAGDLAPSERIARDFDQRSLAATLVVFLGLGLLLSFTPCVLPMVPILSGIIVGQAGGGARRGFVLSVVYVVAMAASYALAGVIAGLLGHNLQVLFQHPIAVGSFSILFVLLALAMFDVFNLALPARWQQGLERLSRTQRGGSYIGVAVMGVLSALIVGPCVAPPLAGALAYISQSGSGLVGGSALFALGLGMGLPLIALGATTGHLLPRVGAWMVGVKQVFGVIFLAVAIYFLSRIVSGPVVLALWAALAFGVGVSLGAFDRPVVALTGARRLRQAAGLLALVYGVVLLVGAAAGADNPWRPLLPFAQSSTGAPGAMTRFIPVRTIADVERAVTAAQADGQQAMLDVYADWCVECKHLERKTFTDPAVVTRLSKLSLLRVDVTADDQADRALLAHFDLYGPPALLFFADGQELRSARINGFVDAADLLEHLATFAAARP